MNLHPLGNPKVTLSEAEFRLVTDAGWILTKNGIIDKVYALFGGLAEHYVQTIDQVTSLPFEVASISPKISRGEKYEDLPWVMLDYPRYFGNDGHFAVRTFFWWGHFFSIRLQLSGQYFKRYASSTFLLPKQLEGWQIGITDNPWNNHLPNPTLRPFSNEESLPEGQYFLASVWLPLQQWEKAEEFLRSSFESIFRQWPLR